MWPRGKALYNQVEHKPAETGVTRQQGTTAEQIGEPAPTNGAGCGDGIHLAVSLNPDAKTGASIPVPAQVLLDHDHMS